MSEGESYVVDVSEIQLSDFFNIKSLKLKYAI